MALGDVLFALGGLLGLIVGTALLTMTPWSRASRVLAVFVLLHGLRRLLQAGVPLVFPELDAVGNVTAVYVLLPAPFVLLVFVLLYPAPRGRIGRSQWLLPGLVVITLILETLYFLDHGLWFAPPGRRIFPGVGPLAWISLAGTVVSTGVVFVLVRDFVRAPGSPHARSLLLLAAVLAAAPSYEAWRNLGFHLAGITAPSVITVFSGVTTAIPLVLAMLLLARRAFGPHPSGERRAAARGLAGIALGPASAVLVTLLVWSVPSIQPAIWGIPNGIFGMASSLLMGYALLRYRLFDIDLRVKRGVRDGTVLASFAAVPLFTKEAVELVLPPPVALLAAFASAGVLLVGLGRVRGFGQHVAEMALPEAKDDPAYLNARKIEVYRSALEASFAGGAPAHAEAPRLVTLREELGLTERDHALLSFALRAGRERPQPLEPGDLALGRYRVERVLGEGGNGVTFAGRDETGAGEAVALKLLRAGVDPQAGPAREAEALAALRHAHVVELREVAAVGGQTLLVMEYLEGGSLAQRIARGPLPQGDFVRVARGLLRGLDAVHATGMVHRDVKPSNVLLTGSGEAKLADFGIAHLPGYETTLGGGDLAGAIGTIRFMSPEQARGRRVTAQSDLFSAAATLYESWTGRAYIAPLPGESAVELQMRAAAGVAFPQDSWQGPPELCAWFARSLDPRPEQRFGDASEMLGALESALDRSSDAQLATRG